jgi:Tol biopolymer transport system component/C-terminal processing protease CtpA/Prc
MLMFDGNSREPSVSKDGKRLRFTREVDGSFELFVCDTEKGTCEQLTRLGDDGASNVCYSADESTAVFVWKFYLHALDLKTPGAKPRLIKVEIREDSRGETMIDRTFTNGVERASLSRDGKTVLFTLGGDIWIMDANGGSARQLTADQWHNQNPQLSPDGRTISFYSDRSGNADIWLMDVDGKNLRQFTKDPADDFFQSWSPDGTALVFTSTRSGNKDIWLQAIDAPNAVQLTNNPANDDDAVFTPDGKQIVFDTARAGGNNADIWIMDADGRNQRRVYGTPAIEEVPVVSPDGRFIAFDRVTQGATFVRQEVLVTDLAGSGEVLIGQGAYASFTPDGKHIMYVNPAGELVYAPTPAGINNGRSIPFIATKRISQKEEMLRSFDEAHRSFEQSFYDPKFHGKDWAALGRKYRELVQAAGTREEYLYYLNRMVGEVSASHTGANAETMRARPTNTGLLGMSLVPEAVQGGRQRLRVDAVDKGGPADQAWIRKGDYIFRVDGRQLAVTDNLDAFLEGKEGQEVAFWVADNPEGNGVREVKVKTESFAQRRQRGYQDYIRACKTTSAQKSSGQVAYIHIANMMPPNLQAFENELANPAVQAAKALIIDVRDNGGGNIHQQLIDILSRRPYAYMQLRDGRRIGQPPVYWNRPIVVMINERSYSDAEVFPHAMKVLGMATLVGMPTPGAVIGTRDIRLSDGTNWRLPSSGFYNIDGMNQERNGCQPHVMVEITPADRLAGRDTQLEKAIEVALDKIRNPANPQPGPVPTPTAPQKEGDFAVPPTEGWLAPVDNPWRYLPPELLR